MYKTIFVLWFLGLFALAEICCVAGAAAVIYVGYRIVKFIKEKHGK